MLAREVKTNDRFTQSLEEDTKTFVNFVSTLFLCVKTFSKNSPLVFFSKKKRKPQLPLYNILQSKNLFLPPTTYQLPTSTYLLPLPPSNPIIPIRIQHQRQQYHHAEDLCILEEFFIGLAAGDHFAKGEEHVSSIQCRDR